MFDATLDVNLDVLAEDDMDTDDVVPSVIPGEDDDTPKKKPVDGDEVDEDEVPAEDLEM